MGTIHIIHIPDREARKRAFKAFLDIRETWVRFPGNRLGVTNEHVRALEKENIPFDYASKPPRNGTPTPIQP